MRKNLNPILSLLIPYLFLLPVMSHASEACKVIKTGGGSWINSSKNAPNSAGGAGIQLMSAIENKLGIKIQIMPASPFARQLHQLQSGEIDALFGIYPVGERLDNFYFSKPYFIEDLHLVSHQDFTISNDKLNNLKQYKGVIVRGASYGKDLDDFFDGNKNIIKVNNHEQRINLVISRRADYFISSSQTAQSKITNHPQLAILNKPISQVKTAIAFSKKSLCNSKINAINSLIESLSVNP